jgi:hypothetical protein
MQISNIVGWLVALTVFAVWIGGHLLGVRSFITGTIMFTLVGFMFLPDTVAVAVLLFFAAAFSLFVGLTTDADGLTCPPLVVNTNVATFCENQSIAKAKH